ncbi:phosphonate ABC transporter ATP-binding protein [uncultured Hydrogenophaga sp.]|uniref:phosphonate ABC transporter ATP-binding protein n=1 Tax=uncultured Hydrogenophaga sp. TaxID=199683 RepID=UPI00258AD972|nr:phosphonate ABC transporter ATP-binding protein [uncultured Hydrogenophaga sp.]
MIKIRGLTKRYGDFDALKGIDLDVAPGEFLVVLGPSGAGKSTLLRCINRLCEPTQGEIHVDGQAVTSDRASLRRARRQVAMIFQHYNVVPRLSVLKNVLTGRLGAMPSVLSWLQVFPRRDIDIARECLRRVELEEKAELRTDTLSGGQKQRVGIARALAQQPRVILADEPVASLDPKTSRTVLQYLKQASRELGITVVCNLHQIEYAREFGERIVGVSGGRIVFEGGPDQLTEEVLHRIYPGLDEGAAKNASPARAAQPEPLHNLALEEA